MEYFRFQLFRIGGVTVETLEELLRLEIESSSSLLKGLKRLDNSPGIIPRGRHILFGQSEC